MKNDHHEHPSPGSGQQQQRGGRGRRLRRTGYSCQPRASQHGAETTPHRVRNYVRLFCVAVAGSHNTALSVQKGLFLNCES